MGERLEIRLNRDSKKSWPFLALVLGAGLIHGLVYLFIVPPWQHNDEPSHFAYAWTCAHHNCISGSRENDPDMSRAVVQSMIEHHFYDGLGDVPDLASGQPVSLGYTQYPDPPLYYLLASLPLRLLGVVAPHVGIDLQLYAVRFVSLLLLLVVILASWGMAREIAGESSPLQWLLPFTLALWPGFVDLMTAITNLVGAVAFFSLFLWFGVRLIRRGLGWLDVSGMFLCIAGCLWTNSVVYVAAPLGGIAVLFAVFRNRWRWCAWALSFCGLLIGLLVSLTWGDADLWYRETWQDESTRGNAPGSPLGEHALQLVAPSQGSVARLYQAIPPSNARKLAGKTVTLGAWMWATQPILLTSPILEMDEGAIQYKGRFAVTETLAFYAITATLGINTARSYVVLSVPAAIKMAASRIWPS